MQGACIHQPQQISTFGKVIQYLFHLSFQQFSLRGCNNQYAGIWNLWLIGKAERFAFETDFQQLLVKIPHITLGDTIHFSFAMARQYQQLFFRCAPIEPMHSKMPVR